MVEHDSAIRIIGKSGCDQCSVRICVSIVHTVRELKPASLLHRAVCVQIVYAVSDKCDLILIEITLGIEVAGISHTRAVLEVREYLMSFRVKVDDMLSVRMVSQTVFHRCSVRLHIVGIASVKSKLVCHQLIFFIVAACFSIASLDKGLSAIASHLCTVSLPVRVQRLVCFDRYGRS